MVTTIPPTAAVHYLVTFTIPFDVDTTTDANVLTFRAGTPTTDARRLSAAESEAVLAVLAPTFEVAIVADTTVFDAGMASGDATRSARDVEEHQGNDDEQAAPAVDGPEARTSPAPVHPPVTKAKAKPVKSATKPVGKRAASKRPSAAEASAINTTIRDALAAGATIEDAAAQAGITVRAAKHRATMLKRREAKLAPLTPEQPASATAEPDNQIDKPAVARRPVPRPTPGPTPGRTVRGNATALGAKRRIRSLFAIGYDQGRLDLRLPENVDFRIPDILALADGSEISVAAFELIDQIWHKLRYSPLPTDLWKADVPRHHTPPGAWNNIDDPDEKHAESAA